MDTYYALIHRDRPKQYTTNTRKAFLKNAICSYIHTRRSPKYTKCFGKPMYQLS